MTNDSNDPIAASLKELQESLRMPAAQQDAQQIRLLADRAYNQFKLSAELPLTALQKALISELASLPKEVADLALLRSRADGALDMCLRFASDLGGPTSSSQISPAARGGLSSTYSNPADPVSKTETPATSIAVPNKNSAGIPDDI